MDMPTKLSWHKVIKIFNHHHHHNEYELVPKADAPSRKAARRIHRYPTNNEELTKNTEPITNANGDNNLCHQTSDNSQEIAALSCESKRGKLHDSLPRFGPIHGNDQPSVLGIKKKAWEHVKTSLSKEDPGLVKEDFSVAIRRVEKRARDTYGEKVPGTRSEFRLMMLKDGCFFLQLVFLILEKSKELGYSDKDPIFGGKLNRRELKSWTKSMFFVGNQLPFVVIKEMMKERFFSDIIDKGKWDPPSSSLLKRVLYEQLIWPEVMSKPQHNRIWSSLIFWKEAKYNRVGHHQCSDLLHGLHDMVVGQAPPEKISDELEEDDDEFDLEANQEVMGNQERPFFATTASPNTNNYDRMAFPCATELKQSHISIRKLKSGGIRGICFKTYWVGAALYLPVLPEDDDIEAIFHNLKAYEISQRFEADNRVVSSYLRLMSDIIQSPPDAKLLKLSGIIQHSSRNKDKWPGILSRLSSEDIRLTHEIRNLRHKIMEYSSPLVRYQGVINLVVFLTVIQVIFAVLAYFLPFE